MGQKGRGVEVVEMKSLLVCCSGGGGPSRLGQDCKS